MLAPSAAWTCEQLPFALTTPVPEASAAAWWQLDGKLSLVVISDSGNHGQYVIVDPETGETTEQSALPLGSSASDDLEGLSARGDKLYGLTSAGWVRVWQREGAAFVLVDGPYALGPVDLPLKSGHHGGSRPPSGDGMVCPAEGMNCGRNFEGLCLAPSAATCTGFVASKADGHLYCLTEVDGKLVVDRHTAIAVSDPGKLADCTFDAAGALWAGENILGCRRCIASMAGSSRRTRKSSRSLRSASATPRCSRSAATCSGGCRIPTARRA